MQKSLESFDDEDFGPAVYKDIKKQLKGKKFFVKDGSNWREASKVEVKNEIEKAFNNAK